MSINYKWELFDVTYTDIKSKILKINNSWLLVWTLKITYDDKLLNLISLYNIEIIKKESTHIEIKYKNFIFMSFITKMLNLWLSKNKSKEYFDSFISSENFIKYPYLIDFYLLQSLLNQEINFYIYWWKVEILSSEEFLIIKNRFSLLDDFISINFNKSMYEISKNNLYLDIKNNSFVIEDNIKTILKKYYDKEYKELKIRKDKWEPYILEWNLEFNHKNTRYVDLEKKFAHSEIISKVYKNKTKKYIVKELTRLDNKNEN